MHLCDMYASSQKRDRGDCYIVDVFLSRFDISVVVAGQ